MTQLRRLTSTSPNPLTRALLAAGREDAPSRQARVNAAIAIGIAGGLATTATAGGAAAGTATTGTVAASKSIGAATLLKVVGTTVVSGALVVGVVHEKQYLAAPAPLSSAHTVVAAAPAQAAVRVDHASTPPPPDSAPAPSEVPPPNRSDADRAPRLCANPAGAPRAVNHRAPSAARRARSRRGDPPRRSPTARPRACAGCGGKGAGGARGPQRLRPSLSKGRPE